jgi:DNA primase small subunit
VQPKLHLQINAASFQPVERELVFDIDLTDYDLEADTIWTGAQMSRKCWPFMAATIHVVDSALRGTFCRPAHWIVATGLGVDRVSLSICAEDFGFQHIMWVYSGRRGVHCWVCDNAARQLTNEGRSAVTDYLSIEAVRGTTM